MVHPTSRAPGRDWQPAARVLALSCALAACGCRASFEVSPAEAPRLTRGGTVRSLDGEQHEVPETFEAVVVTRRIGGRRLMLLRHGDGPLVATPVPDAYVDRAEAAGLSDDEVRFAQPIEAGVVPMGSGLAASRGDQPQLPPPGTPPVLWLRDDEHRIVELELAYVKYIDVDETGLSGGAVAGIVLGSVAGGALIVGIAAVAIVAWAQTDID